MAAARTNGPDASVVRVAVQERDDRLHPSIRNDGVGGADPARGSGLIGLRDRGGPGRIARAALPVPSTPTRHTVPNPPSQPSRRAYPPAVAGNPHAPGSPPIGASAAATWTSAWVSTPPVIDLPRAFRTAYLRLIYAADCRSTYSSCACRGLRY